jgi:hypothetical protein
MRPMLDPFRLLLISLAGYLNQQQHDIIEYLQEENRVLREQVGSKRLRLNDDQRRRLAVRAKKLGRRVLRELATIVTPETLLAWHRKLIARKYDGRKQRGFGPARSWRRRSGLGKLRGNLWRSSSPPSSSRSRELQTPYAVRTGHTIIHPGCARPDGLDQGLNVLVVGQLASRLSKLELRAMKQLFR